MPVVSVGVTFAAVQDVPPFQESWTHIAGVPEVESDRASRRTSIPWTAWPAGTASP